MDKNQFGSFIKILITITCNKPLNVPLDDPHFKKPPLPAPTATRIFPKFSAPGTEARAVALAFSACNNADELKKLLVQLEDTG